MSSAIVSALRFVGISGFLAGGAGAGVAGPAGAVVGATIGAVGSAVILGGIVLLTGAVAMAEEMGKAGKMSEKD